MCRIRALRTAIWIILAAWVLAAPVMGASDGAKEPERSIPERFTNVARSLVTSINEGDYQAMSDRFSAAMRDAMPPDRAQTFFGGLRSRLGRIEKCEAKKVSLHRTATFTLNFARGAKRDMKIVLDDRDLVAGLWIREHTEPAPVPDRNQTELSLPFRGQWKVVWGGDTRELNRHHDVPNERYAFDFIGVGPDGETRKGSALRNTDYYAFGRDVLAPAAGTVTEVIRGVHDCRPETMNPFSGLGNAVFIQHSEHEVSVLAHLKQGSVKVEVGDTVERGQVVGRCGNSGNSSEPHIHFHLQNVPRIEEATSIKCFFRDVRLTDDDGTRDVEDCSPVKGDVVAPVE